MDRIAIGPELDLADLTGPAAGDLAALLPAPAVKALLAAGDPLAEAVGRRALKAASGKGGKGKKAGGHWITVFAHGRPIHVHVDGPPHPGHGKGKVHTRHYEAESDLHAEGQRHGFKVEVAHPRNAREAAAAKKAAARGKELVHTTSTPHVARHGDEWHVGGEAYSRVVPNPHGEGHMVQRFAVDPSKPYGSPREWRDSYEHRNRAEAEEQAAGYAEARRDETRRDSAWRHTPHVGRTGQLVRDIGEAYEVGHLGPHHDTHIRIIRPAED